MQMQTRFLGHALNLRQLVGVPRLALLSPLLVLLVLVRVRESGFCRKIWIRFFYGCGGCAVYFVFSTFLLFQIFISS